MSSQPIDQDYRSIGSSDAQIEYISDGRSARLSFTVGRQSIASVINQWTFNPGIITITSGNQSIQIIFPAIHEQVKR